MNNTTTNKLMEDTNSFVPRIIKRGTLSVTNTYPVGGNYGTNSVTLSDINFSNHNIVEVYRIFATDNYAEKLTISTQISGSIIPTLPRSVWFTIDSNAGSLRINIYETVTFNTDTFCYVVYSTTYI